MNEGLHARLRIATAESHRALERDLDWEARTATLTGYRDLLALMHGFHAGLEPAIGLALADDAFFAPRRRLALLKSDLGHLGLDTEAIAALPVCRPSPLPNASAAFGALYVLEGSTLGGQMIGRSIAARHGPETEAACRYYRGHGRETGRMWNAFRNRLDARGGEADADDALAAGITTFDTLRDWVARQTPPARLTGF